MNASSSTSATAAATIAFRTKPAGPSLRRFSKTDAIAKSETGFPAIVCAFLIGCQAGHILRRREAELEAAAIGLGRKATDLVGLREVLRSRGKQHAPPDSRKLISNKRKSDSGES